MQVVLSGLPVLPSAGAREQLGALRVHKITLTLVLSRQRQGRMPRLVLPLRRNAMRNSTPGYKVDRDVVRTQGLGLLPSRYSLRGTQQYSAAYVIYGDSYLTLTPFQDMSLLRSQWGNGR